MGGFCYPEGSADCQESNAPGACGQLSSPFVTAKPDETCCAPLGNAGAFMCVRPETSLACDACAIPSGSDYTPALCEGQACPRAIAAGLGQIGAFTADDTNVYFSSVEDEQVLSIALPGDVAPRVLATNVGYVISLVPSGGQLYLASESGISRVPVGGGTPEVIAPGATTTDPMVVAGSTLFWKSTHGPLTRMSVDGGASEVVAEGTFTTSFAVDATSLYFSTQDPPNIWVAPLRSGSAPVPLAPGVSAAIAVDDLNLYWVASRQSNCGAIHDVIRQPLAGGEPIHLTSVRGELGQPVVVGENLYFIAGGSILRVPREGGDITALSATDAPSHLMHEGQNLYWQGANDSIWTVAIQ